MGNWSDSAPRAAASRLYVVLIIIRDDVLSFFDVPLGGLMLSRVYFVLGYLVRLLMAGFGMIGRTQQERRSCRPSGRSRR